MRKAMLAILAAAVLAVAPVRAADQAPANDKAGDGEVMEWLDEVHEQGSVGVRRASNWVDHFFDDERTAAEENRSRVRLRMTAGVEEGDGVDFEPRANIRLHLPQLSNRLNLLFFASEDENPEEDSTRPDPDVRGDNNKKDAAVALQYFLRESDKSNISVTLGGSYDYLYTGVRGRYLKEFGPWTSRLVSQLRYYTDNDWKFLNSLDFERPLSERWFFRATGQLDWIEEDDELPGGLLFRLYQALDVDKVLSYEWHNSFDDVGNEDLSEVKLQVRYRQRYLRDWLFFEVSPYVKFEEEEDWNTVLGFFGKIEIIFGFSGTGNGDRVDDPGSPDRDL